MFNWSTTISYILLFYPLITLNIGLSLIIDKNYILSYEQNKNKKIELMMNRASLLMDRFAYY